VNKYSIFLFTVFFTGCATVQLKPKIINSSSAVKPSWIKSETPKELPEEILFRGEGRAKQKSIARQEAYNDAIYELLYYIGCHAKSKYKEILRKRNGKSGEIVIIDRGIKSETKIRGIREKDFWWESRKRGAERYYQYWVLLEISNRDIEQARYEMGKIEKKLNAEEEAKEMLKRGELEQENGRIRDSLHYYEEAKAIAMNFGLPVIKAQAEVEIESLQRLMKNPKQEFIAIKGNHKTITFAKLVNREGEELTKPILQKGDMVKVKIEIRMPTYAYIVGYDNSSTSFNLIFPNGYDMDNFAKQNGNYPNISWIKAVPPFGSNFLKVICVDEPIKIDIPPSAYVQFTKDSLATFLSKIKSRNWDATTIEFWIEE